MEKYILSEEDIKNLSPEQQYAYNQFLNTIRNKGVIYDVELRSFDEILQQQYESGVFGKGDINVQYPRVLAANLQNIIDTITGVRNDTINGKRSFGQFNFSKINEGLEVLKSFTEKTLQGPRGHAIGRQDLESVLPRIEQLESQISKDIQFFQGYSDERTAAINDYRNKKAAYDRLSLFGKLAARVNGKKEELSEAQQKNAYYNTEKVGGGSPQPGDIVNPYQYDEYVERQQPDQTGGMKR